MGLHSLLAKFWRVIDEEVDDDVTSRGLQENTHDSYWVVKYYTAFDCELWFATIRRLYCTNSCPKTRIFVTNQVAPLINREGRALRSIDRWG